MKRISVLLVAVALGTVSCGIPVRSMRPDALQRYEMGSRGRSVMGFSWMPTLPSATMRAGRFTHHRIRIYFTSESSLDRSCDRTIAFTRHTIGVDVLHDAISQLMRGPRRSEQADGARSFFSRRTAGLLNDVRIEDGVAFVDFDDLRRVIPGASSSCGSASLLSELERTAMQFPTVDRVVFSLEGSRRAFYNWLQLSVPNI